MDRFDNVNDTPNYQDSDRLNHTFDTQVGSMYNVSKAIAQQDKKIEEYTGYTKGEIDTLLNTKANVDDVYNKTETDDLLDTKANVDDVYNKTETDDLLDNKADLQSYTQDFWAKSVNVGGTYPNYLSISTPDNTGTYITNHKNNIIIQAGQSDAPDKNIILIPNGSVICHSALKFAFGHTAKVPTPTANEDAVPKSYVDDNLDTKVNKNSLYAHYINGYGSSGSVCFTTFDNKPTITISNATDLYNYLSPWQNVYLPCSGSVYINSQFSANPVCSIRRANGSIYFRGKATDGTYNTNDMPYDISSLGAIFNTISVYNQKLI